MRNKVEKPLVVSSIEGLWGTYMSDSAAICIFKHCLKHVDIKETKEILQYALDLAEQHIEEIEGIYCEENIPIPEAFGDDDVDTNTSRLFTDAYYLFYLNTLLGFGIDGYSLIVRYTANSSISFRAKSSQPASDSKWCCNSCSTVSAISASQQS